MNGDIQHGICGAFVFIFALFCLIVMIANWNWTEALIGTAICVALYYFHKEKS